MDVYKTVYKKIEEIERRTYQFKAGAFVKEFHERIEIFEGVETGI